MKVLRVVGWADHFEVNRTRELKRMSWIPVPTKQDGDGYCTLVTHPNGAAHLGAWLAILQIAAKCDVRGTLVRRSGAAHTPHSLAVLSHLPAVVFEEAIPRLLQEVGWLEEVEMEEVSEIPHQYRTNTAPSCGLPAASRARDTGQNITEQDSTVQNRTAGVAERNDRPPARQTLDVPELQRLTAEILGFGPDEVLCRRIIENLGSATGQDWQAELRRAQTRIGGPGLLPKLAEDAARHHAEGLERARAMLIAGKLGPADRGVLCECYPELLSDISQETAPCA